MTIVWCLVGLLGFCFVLSIMDHPPGLNRNPKRRS